MKTINKFLYIIFIYIILMYGCIPLKTIELKVENMPKKTIVLKVKEMPKINNELDIVLSNTDLNNLSDSWFSAVDNDNRPRFKAENVIGEKEVERKKNLIEIKIKTEKSIKIYCTNLYLIANKNIKITYPENYKYLSIFVRKDGKKSIPKDIKKSISIEKNDINYILSYVEKKFSLKSDQNNKNLTKESLNESKKEKNSTEYTFQPILSMGYMFYEFTDNLSYFNEETTLKDSQDYLGIGGILTHKNYYVKLYWQQSGNFSEPATIQSIIYPLVTDDGPDYYYYSKFDKNIESNFNQSNVSLTLGLILDRTTFFAGYQFANTNFDIIDNYESEKRYSKYGSKVYDKLIKLKSDNIDYDNRGFFAGFGYTWIINKGELEGKMAISLCDYFQPTVKLDFSNFLMLFL